MYTFEEWVSKHNTDVKVHAYEIVDKLVIETELGRREFNKGYLVLEEMDSTGWYSKETFENIFKKLDS